MQVSYSYSHKALPLATKVINSISKIKALTVAVSAKAIASSVAADTRHHFSDGQYMREMRVPAGSVIVGKIHTTRFMNIVLKGKGKIITPLRTFFFEAPCVFESYEGEQKVGIFYEDTIWTTVHPTDETDVSKIEQSLVTDEYDSELLAKLIKEGALCQLHG